MPLFRKFINRSKSVKAQRAFAADDGIIHTGDGRELLRYRALANQDRIVALGKKHKQVYLVPTPPRGCGGNVEHYFHFLFDLVLPLTRLVEQNKSIRYHVNGVGPFTELLQRIFPKTVCIEPAMNSPSHELVGMNPRCSHVNAEDLLLLNQRIRRALSIPAARQDRRVLLIERIKPADYYLKEATVKGGGSARRSIVNHEEFRTAVEELIPPGYELTPVRLEELSFDEQVALFSESALVIAQHGAGLGNCIWMNTGAAVVEVGDPKLDHFKNLAIAKGQRHLRYAAEEDHVTVDCVAFQTWFQDQEQLSRFVKGQ